MKIWKTNLRAIKMINKLCPGYIHSLILSSVLNGISPYFNIYMAAEIISLLAAGEGPEIYRMVAVTVLGNFAISVINILVGRWAGHKNELFQEEEKRYTANKIQSMDYCDIEGAKVRQLRQNIVEASRMNGRGTGALLDNLCSLVNGFISICIAVFFLCDMIVTYLKASTSYIGLILLTILFILLVINIVVNFKYNKIESVWADENARMLADENRIDGALDCYNKGKDIRIYRQDKIIMPLKWKYLIDIHRATFTRFFKKVFRAQTGISVIKFLIEIVTYLFVCIYALQRIFAVGSVVKYIGFLKNLIDAIIRFFGSFSTLKYNSPFLEQYMEFFYYPSKMHNGTKPLVKTPDVIEFRDVSFSYPGTDTYALRHISLKLKAGEKTAIVGMNGSGKTTLIKLLCRLYEPTEGEILLDGVDVREYRYEDYIQQFSALFQDFKLFSFTLGKNVSLSKEMKTDKIRKCLEQAGFKERLDTLPKGLDTALYKDFDEEGIEISGGEAQKIAMARALYQDAPFILLDEPTAALDPVSEYELYMKLEEVALGKTVVYISHRLSSCRFCNHIIVMHEGTIVQAGNHDELIQDEQNIYANLWNAQAQYYI